MAGIVEPVPRGLERLLRRAVLDHATSEHRRSFPALVHVGVPGRVDTVFELGRDRLDHALRVDVLEALVRRARGSRELVTRSGAGPARTASAPLLVWLTRAGALDVQDVDLAWSAAAHAAAGELETVLPMVVVNRRSWRDVRSGTGRTWQRIRDRTNDPAQPTPPPPLA